MYRREVLEIYPMIMLYITIQLWIILCTVPRYVAPAPMSTKESDEPRQRSIFQFILGLDKASYLITHVALTHMGTEDGERQQNTPYFSTLSVKKL